MKNKILIFFLCMVFLCMPVMLLAGDIGAVNKTIFAWLDAWKSKNIQKYRSFYSPDFKTGRSDYHNWMQKKKYVFKKPGPILLKISKPEISFNGKQAIVTFNQRYKSANIEDFGKKKLTLVKNGKTWKIASEEWETISMSIPMDKHKSDSKNKVIVKSIDYYVDKNLSEKVFIKANRYFKPRIIALEGKKPRIAIDISNISLLREHRKIPVNGRLIRRIRTHLHRSSKTLRIVLDLNPEKEYDVKQAYFKDENIYGIEIKNAAFQKYPELDASVFDLII